jgi:prepilin-type N-terminal cleavage/methylation domain-containing protein
MGFQRGGPRASRAFSLVEMMVVMSLLSMIVLGLYSIFSRTQRALLSNNAQVDVLENGRTTLDFLGREIEQAMAWGHGDVYTKTPHLWIQLAYVNPSTHQPYVTPLTDGKTYFTNLIDECFFLSRSNGFWTGNGYFLAVPTNGTRLDTNAVALSGIGTLYRFSAHTSSSTKTSTSTSTGSGGSASASVGTTTRTPTPTLRLRSVDYESMTNVFNLSKTDATLAFPIAEGITHFSLRPYDANGCLLTNNFNPITSDKAMSNIWTWTYTTNGYYVKYSNPNVIWNYAGWNDSTRVLGKWNWQFYSNSLPAYLELEIGIIPPYILQRMRSMPTATAQRAYLEKQPGAVNIFRKMIPLRNAQP